MIKQISSLGFGLTLALAALTGLFGAPQQGFQCLFGGALVTSNLIIVYWTIRQIFLKKSVALAIGVIVFKYAILLGLFVFIYRTGWRITGGFVIGLSVMFPVLLNLAIRHLKKSE